jgi:hypothetical protein
MMHGHKNIKLKLRKSWSLCATNEPRPLRPKQYTCIILTLADTVWANDSVGEKYTYIYIYTFFYYLPERCNLSKDIQQ